MTLALAWTPMLVARAQEATPAPAIPAAGAPTAPPVVTVTLGSINKLTADISYLSAMMGQPQAGGMFAMMATSMAQGVDMNQPIGILVPLVDGMPQPIAVLPTANVKEVLRRLEGQTGPADELDDGTLVIAMGVNTIYIKQLGSWAAVSNNRESLKYAPTDPTTYFSGMGNEYFLAVRLQMQQVPAETRQILIDQMRGGFERAMSKNGNDEQARQIAEGSLDQLTQIIEETDQLDIGLNVDQSAGEVVIDTSFTAVPGTNLADVYAGQRALPSKFASVIRPDAAGYYHASTSISPAAIEQVKETIERNMQMLGKALEQEDDLNDAQRAEIERLIEQIVDLGVRSIEEGRADIGTMLLTGEGNGQLVSGFMVADGSDAAKILKDFAARIQNEPDAPRFLFDVDKYGDVTLHRVEADVPADKDEARKIFGETLQVHIGTAPKAVYLAVGPGSLDLMKGLVDAEPKMVDGETPPLGQLRIQMLPILQYAQSIEDNDTIAAMIDALSASPDAGVVNFLSEPIVNGSKSHVTLSEGLLRAVGAAVAANQPQPANF